MSPCRHLTPCPGQGPRCTALFSKNNYLLQLALYIERILDFLHSLFWAPHTAQSQQYCNCVYVTTNFRLCIPQQLSCKDMSYPSDDCATEQRAANEQKNKPGDCGCLSILSASGHCSTLSNKLTVTLDSS